VLRGGRSFGIAAHWQPVLSTYISPLTISRSSTVRLLPPRLAGGINGPIKAHSSSLKSLGYRSLLRSYRARFSTVHIRRLLRIDIAASESQPIRETQHDPGWTLEKEGPESFGQIMDSLYIGFSKRGPVVTDLSVMQQEQNLIGHVKLSEIPGVVTVKEKVNYYGDLLTAETAEMLLQRGFMQAAEQITGKIFGKSA